MTLKKQTQQQQYQQQEVRLLSSSPPPIPQNNPASSPPSSTSPTSSSSQRQYSNQGIEEQQWGRSATTNHSPSSTTETVNDRFIHESGPPTALSILRTQPAFIGKLYKMLEDTSQELICWSNNGEYFSVYNSALFSRQILPQYFKHNNWQSFVRQLNMYGFSKINEMIHSNLSIDNQTWDFKHPHFKRGDFQSLTLVKRKSVRSSPMSATGSSSALSSSTPYLATNQIKVNTGARPVEETSPTDRPTNQIILPSTSPPQQIAPHQQQQYSMDDAIGVENRVMQLDEQVNEVSDSVIHLTTELQDIKSLIYKQQAMIHDLANLVRACHGPSSSSAAAANLVASLSSKLGTEEPSAQRTTNLPSIHNLATNLQHSANIDTTPMLPDHRGYHPQPQLQSFHSYQLIHHPQQTYPYTNTHHHRHQQQQQLRRSSHPSSSSQGSNKPSRISNPIYPLLNSMSDEEDAR